MATIIINNVEYPTFATVKQADEYFNAKFGSAWSEIDELDKNKLLVTATREINNLCFKGCKVDIKQDLAFPRVICCKEVYPKNDLIACCAEIANAFYNTNLEISATPNADKIKSMSVGDTSITYKDGATIDADIFSAIAKPLANKYLSKWLRGNIKVIL